MIVALNISLLRHDICFQSLFSSFLKEGLHSMNVSGVTDIVLWQIPFLAKLLARETNK